VYWEFKALELFGERQNIKMTKLRLTNWKDFDLSTRMGRMHFSVELGWELRDYTLEHLMHNSEFMTLFSNFLHTQEGREWQMSEIGKEALNTLHK
jgi:hypothetical protein